MDSCRRDCGICLGVGQNMSSNDPRRRQRCCPCIPDALLFFIFIILAIAAVIGIILFVSNSNQEITKTVSPTQITHAQRYLQIFYKSLHKLILLRYTVHPATRRVKYSLWIPADFSTYQVGLHQARIFFNTSARFFRHINKSEGLDSHVIFL